MNLTEQELGHISSGIYRTYFSGINGVPDLRPAEFEYANIPQILERLIAEDQTQHGLSAVITGKEKADGRGYWPQRTYFPSIEPFLDAWKRGYEMGVSQFGVNQV